MRNFLFSALVLTVVSCAPRQEPSSQAKSSGSPPLQKMTSMRQPDPMWMFGTAVTNSADVAVIMEHMPPDMAGLPATKAFKDIQLLFDADAKTVALAMHGIERSLGVKCEHCHTEKKFEADTEKKKIARQMLVMTEDLNRVAFGGKAELTCWTCHQGEDDPEKMPKDMERRIAKATPAEFKIPAADAKKPAKDVFKNLQLLGNTPAGQIPGIMGFFSASLGKDCAYCHVKDDAASDDNEHKRAAREMMRMSTRASATIEGTRGALTCWTCHRGASEPSRSPFEKKEDAKPAHDHSTHPH